MPHMNSIREFLRKEYRTGQKVFPPKDKIFRALKSVDYNDVRVVILGQDPYHGENQANGFAFAVRRGIPAPPSLQNIFKEIGKEFHSEPPQDTELEGWAEQGVLLLNTVLTVRAGQAFSHHGHGWEVFTDSVISELNRRAKPLVFILWGAAAQKKAILIDAPQHLILKGPHPSPLSAHRGFFGCDHFKKANEFLKRHGDEINWLKT